MLLVTLFPMVTEPNTTAGLSDQRIFQLLCIRFVYSSVRRLSRCFKRVHPFNFVHFASGAPPTRIFPFLALFNKTDLRGDSTNSADFVASWKYDSSMWQFWIRVGKHETLMRLFLFAFEYYQDSRGGKIGNNFCHVVFKICDISESKV